jgi:hypothetical protein
MRERERDEAEVFNRDALQRTGISSGWQQRLVVDQTRLNPFAGSLRK